MFTPLGAEKSGLFLKDPSVNVPPLDENEDTVGKSTPKAGVFVYNTEATDIAPAAFACPNKVDVPLLYSLIVISPLNTTYLNLALPVPDLRVIMIFAFVIPLTVKGKTSTGSSPIFFLLKPNNNPPV